MIPHCDVLIFGAHPDDAELLCGGTIAKLSQHGKKVFVVDCTQAELSTNGDVKTRRKETKKASAILGIEKRINLNRADGQLNQDRALQDLLVQQLRQHSPAMVIGPPPLCRHPDHQALHDHLKSALFFCGLKKYSPELPHITRPQHLCYIEVSEVKPDLLIDISDQWPKRVEAIMAYASQFVVDPSKDKTFINDGFLERLERRYRSYGESIGAAYAEPFTSSAPVHVSLPTDLC
jgi:bacillithiol biosynthesis deacetylase BshB1